MFVRLPHKAMRETTRIFITLAVAAVSCVLLFAALRPMLSTLVRQRLEQALSKRFESQVRFSSFEVSLFPQPSATLSAVTLIHHNRIDVPPLLQIARLSAAMRWSGLFTPRLRITRVVLSGLQITLPPRQNAPQPSAPYANLSSPSTYPIRIREINTTDAKIILLRAQPEKRPLVYLIRQLRLRNFSFDDAARFEATLINAVPRGDIHVYGTFGPWDAATPRTTPIHASYEFSNADLSTINGLEGILSSTGSFSGPLDYLEVTGTTVTPNFSLRRVANPVDLHTEFSASVDGTNGNTYLHSVAAHFLRSTLFVNGQVVDRNSSVPGRTIVLHADSHDARAEDLIRLAARTEAPVVRGPVHLSAEIHIPEEDIDLSDRLQVSAEFALTDGHFSDPKIQEKVDLLSRKGQGHPKDTEIAHVPTNLLADMDCKHAVVHFSQIQFAVPGARLHLSGAYTLGNGDLHFNGDLFLDAKLSQTTTGPQSLLLKAVDPFFRGKNGGARIPVTVAGTKDHPTFGVGREKHAKQAPDTGSRAAEITFSH